MLGYAKVDTAPRKRLLDNVTEDRAGGGWNVYSRSWKRNANAASWV